jgi:DHA1 family multidrug resistance protein-like MFS transporter
MTEGVAAWAGVLGAANALGMIIMSPVWGAMGDRFGRKLMMLRAGTVLVLAYLAMSLVTNPYQFLVVRAAIGALTGFIPTAIALVGTTTPQEHLGRAMASVSTAAPVGAIAGPLLGGVIVDLYSIRGTMLYSAAAIAIATVLVLLFVKEQFTPRVPQKGTFFKEMGDILRYPAFRALLGTTVFAMASIGALEPVLLPYIKTLLGSGSANWLAGGVYALPGIAFAIAAPWWGRSGERWGFGKTITAGLAVGALFVVPQALVNSAWAFSALRLAQGLAMASVNPGVATLIAQVLPQTVRGRAYGLNHSAVSIGAMLGPLIGGFVATGLGPRSAFVASTLLIAAGALWTSLVVSPLVPGGTGEESQT